MLRPSRETVKVPRRPAGTTTSHALPATLCYLLLNILLNFVNKALFSHDSFTFPLALIQSNMALVSLTLALYLRRAGKWEAVRARLLGMTSPVLLTGLAHSYGIALENAAIVRVSLATNQIVKALGPVLVLTLSRWIEGRRHSWRVHAATLVLCLGAGLTLVHSPDWDTAGVALSLGSALLGSLATVLTAVLVSVRGGGGGKAPLTGETAGSAASSGAAASSPALTALGASSSDSFMAVSSPRLPATSGNGTGSGSGSGSSRGIGNGNGGGSGGSRSSGPVVPGAAEAEDANSSVGIVAAAFATTFVGALGLFPIVLVIEGHALSVLCTAEPLLCSSIILGTFVLALAYTLAHFWLIQATGSVYSTAVGNLKVCAKSLSKIGGLVN
jgi:hypothetical protein